MKANNYVIPLVAISVYLIFLYFGPKIMAKIKPLQLDNQLCAWNLLLAVFSTYGAIRTVPHMYYRLTFHTFEQTVCQPAVVSYGGGACGLASQLFILSKLPELIDTVFIVLRKKPLIFLHWYHHVTVLLYSWNAYVTESGAGLYFISMNYSVHTVMYCYYFLVAAKRVPNWVKQRVSWITVFQISQMVVGTGVVGASLVYHFFGGREYAPGQCNNEPSNLFAGFLVYGSYLCLFVDFFVRKYRKSGGRKNEQDDRKDVNKKKES